VNLLDEKKHKIIVACKVIFKYMEIPALAHVPREHAGKADLPTLRGHHEGDFL